MTWPRRQDRAAPIASSRSREPARLAGHSFARPVLLHGAASGGRRLESQGHAVHAIAESGRFWSVVENVAKVTVAPAAGHRGADHSVGPVVVGIHRIVERRPEARPAGAAVELGRGREKVGGAAGAGENPLPFLMQK